MECLITSHMAAFPEMCQEENHCGNESQENKSLDIYLDHLLALLEGCPEDGWQKDLKCTRGSHGE